MTSFKDSFWGPNGFEELKKYMRAGNDFCRELANIFTERSDIELTYSKSLSKNGSRLQKLSKEFAGGLSDAWFQISLQFDSEAEMHKSFSAVLQEEIIKPLKNLYESQAKARKPIEANVEKCIKTLADSRAKDYKYRARCFKTVKDIENTMYALDEAQKGMNGKPPKQKDVQKLEDNLDNLNKLLTKSETKYHKACGCVEVARQDWQLSIYRSSEQLQMIEEERISYLDNLLKKYTFQINESTKKLSKMVEGLSKIEINVKRDIEIAVGKYGTSKNEQEIYLLDIYSENTKNMMYRDRRINNLTKWSQLIKTDYLSQDKIVEGIEKVRTFNKQNPKFGTNDDELLQKIQSIKLVKILYEACLFKIDSALADILDKPKPQIMENNNYLKNISTTYDKLGIPISVLKLSPNTNDLTIIYNTNFVETYSKPSAPILPSNGSNGNAYVTNTSISMPQPTYISNSHYLALTENTASLSKNNGASLSTTEYSDDDEWNDEPNWNSKCIVQYEYKGERGDELFLKLGDIIKVIERRPDGWWKGELNGKIGLFPSTYVKELE